MTTVADIVNDVIVELSQVPGLATQVYASPRIAQYVENTFDLLFDEQWWDEYMTWGTYAVDGANGYLTSDVTGPLGYPLTRYTDIRHVFPENSNRELRELPPGVNPFTITTSGGGRAVYRAPDSTYTSRPLRLWPNAATGNVVLSWRQRPPHPFGNTDVVLLDRLMLTYGAAWMYLSDDSTAPGQQQKMQTLFQKRVRQMQSAAGRVKLQLDPRHAGGNDTWQELG